MKQHLNIRAIDRGESLRGTDELAYMDGAENEVRGKSLQHVYRKDALVGDPLEERRQIRLHGLHPRGKELSLFSSTGCETIGWMSV